VYGSGGGSEATPSRACGTERQQIKGVLVRNKLEPFVIAGQ